MNYTLRKNPNVIHKLSIFFVILYLTILFSSAFIYIPVILIFLSLLIFKNFSSNLSVFISIIFVAIAASAKTLQGDLKNYERYYLYVKDNDLQTVLFSWLSESSVRDTEIFFKFYNIIFAKLGINFEFFHIITICLIYLSMLFFALNINDILGSKAKKTFFDKHQDKIFVILWTLLIGVSFTLTSQVVKQYISIALISIAIVLMLNNRKSFLPYIFIIISIFTHNATAIILPLIFFAFLFKNIINNNFVKVLFVISAIASGFALTNLINILGLSAIFSYGGMENANLGITVIFDFLILFLVFFVMPKNAQNKDLMFLRSLIFLFICFLLFSRDIPILLARVYFYMDIFRIFAGIYIYQTLQKKDKSLFLTLLLFFGPIYWNLKLFSSDWDYSWFTSSDHMIQMFSN